jgi:hypothetical protein
MCTFGTFATFSRKTHIFSRKSEGHSPHLGKFQENLDCSDRSDFLGRNRFEAKKKECPSIFGTYTRISRKILLLRENLKPLPAFRRISGKSRLFRKILTLREKLDVMKKLRNG